MEMMMVIMFESLEESAFLYEHCNSGDLDGVLISKKLMSEHAVTDKSWIGVSSWSIKGKNWFMNGVVGE